ncbi:MAG: Crp/Fnr family transcriptional regulator [Firmicutes bacterium]|nr:Crp/Fnr family transcriptional regulator [Bacillota bacterium]
MEKYCKHCIYETLPHNLVTFSSQETIFMEGLSLSSVYRVKEGLVKVNRMHPSGDEKTFDILGPGDYLALLAVLQGKKEYIATAVAITDVTAVQITFDNVVTAYQSNSVFQATCLHCAVTRSTMFQDKLFQTTNIDTEEKILATLQLLANKFGLIQDGIVEMKLPITKTVLASIIGIRRETLSRKLSEMQQKKIIQIHENIYKFDRL